MSLEFQGDIKLYSTEDGGEIEIDENNLIVEDQGFDTALYLSLFGGNINDDGTSATKKYEYWGNKLEKENPNNKLVSRTQNIIYGLSATSSNLLKLKEAVKLDLQWFINEKIIDEFEITVTIPRLNWVSIVIQGMKDKNKLFDLKYEKNWLSKIDT